MAAVSSGLTTRTPRVEEQISAIETEMQLASAGLNVEVVLRIEDRFQELRTRALRENAAVAPHMPRLRELRGLFERLKAPLAAELVDELHRTRTAIEAAERREETLRETVVWLSRTCGRDEVRGTAVGAEVRGTVRHALPHAGTLARSQLEKLVNQHQLWGELSMLSGPKLSKAIDAGRFAGEAGAEVTRLCPRSTSYSVRLYERREAAGRAAPNAR